MRIINVACYVPGCLGNYNLANIALFARKRFIEGCSTIDLMRNARTNREKEEIALVAMLDLNDKTVTDMRLDCKHAGTCKVTNCRNLLKKMIKEGLVQKDNSPD
jgi:hypothetical protein